MSLTSGLSKELWMQNLFDMKPDNQLEEFTIIDIPQVWDLEPDKQPECCIYRVPQNLRNINEDA